MSPMNMCWEKMTVKARLQKKNQSGNRDEERISVGKDVRETNEAYGSPVMELKTLLQITLCKTYLHPSFCLNMAGSAKEIYL